MEQACAIPTGTLEEFAGLPDEVRVHQSFVITSEHVRPLREIKSRQTFSPPWSGITAPAPSPAQLKIGPATLFRKLKEYADGHGVVVFLTKLARRTLELAGTTRLTRATPGWRPIF